MPTSSAHCPSVGDARATLEALREILAAGKHRTARGLRRSSGDAEGRMGRDGRWDPRGRGPVANLTQANVIGMVNAASGPRDVVVCAAAACRGTC